jgi:long-chain fatty acid transport protein
MAVLMIMLATKAAYASGYQLNEYSVTGLGRAFAGSGVVGDDYSAVAFNPAGMVLKGSGMQTGATVVQMHSNTDGYLSLDSNPSTTFSGPRGKIRLYKTLPHFFAQHQVNDDLYIGGGVYSPFGLASEYNPDWFGASHGIKADLYIIDFALGGAYRLNRQWSIGGMLINRYVRGDITSALSPALPHSRNNMDLTGWEFAYNFGIMYEPVKDTRFGLAYRLNTAHTVTGDHTIWNAGGLDGQYRGKSTMKLPDQITLSAYHKLNDKIGLSGTARWTKWKVFDNFILSSSRPVREVIPERWENVWTFAAGVDYYHTPQWTLRAGVSYDPSAITSSTYRTARIPDTDRLWVTAGASYKMGSLTFDAGYAHLFMHDGKINNSNGLTTMVAESSNYSNMFGLQVQYDF